MRTQTHQMTSFDGCPITYYLLGDEGPWLVLANGHGGNLGIWDPVLKRLDGRIRILTWDYRGHYHSGQPTRIPSIDDHCRDLQEILSIEGLPEFALMGWSLGVQVALETYRRNQENIGSLFLMHGAHDRLVKRVYDGRFSPLLSPMIKAVASAEPMLQPYLSRMATALIDSPLGPTAFRTLGFVRRADEPFLDLARAVAGLDLSQYLRVALEATSHQTEDWLETISVPVIVTAGRRDVLTPPNQIRRAFERIPDATYHELDGGHFPLVEDPDLVAELMLRAVDLSIQAGASETGVKA